MRPREPIYYQQNVYHLEALEGGPLCGVKGGVYTTPKLSSDLALVNCQRCIKYNHIKRRVK